MDDSNVSSVVRLVTVILFGILVQGCARNDSGQDSLPNSSVAVPDTTVYRTGFGRVQSVNPSKTFVVIRHGAIPGFMSAMTMPFPVRDSSIVATVQPTDSVEFILSVTGSDVFLSQISVVVE